MIPVTVVIPCHNMAATLPRAVESAANAAEIIVVDDASAEALDPQGGTWLMRTASVFPSGVAAARNLAIETATYGNILPLDADDTLLPGALDAMLAAWRPGTMVYGGWIENGEVKQAPPIGMITRKNVCHATLLFAKADWQRVGGYNIHYNVGYEDWEFMLRLRRAGVQAVRLEQPLYVRHISENGRTASVVKYDKLIREMLKIDGLL